VSIVPSWEIVGRFKRKRGPRNGSRKLIHFEFFWRINILSECDKYCLVFLAGLFGEKDKFDEEVSQGRNLEESKVDHLKCIIQVVECGIGDLIHGGKRLAWGLKALQGYLPIRQSMAPLGPYLQLIWKIISFREFNCIIVFSTLVVRHQILWDFAGIQFPLSLAMSSLLKIF
jgi:hypothetical protein